MSAILYAKQIYNATLEIDREARGTSLLLCAAAAPRAERIAIRIEELFLPQMRRFRQIHPIPSIRLFLPAAAGHTKTSAAADSLINRQHSA